MYPNILIAMVYEPIYHRDSIYFLININNNIITKKPTQNNIVFVWAKVANSGLSHRWEFVLMFGSLCFRVVVSSFWLSCLHSVSLLLEKRSCWEGGYRCVHRLVEQTGWLVTERRHCKYNPFTEFVRLSYTKNLLLLAGSSTQATVIFIALKLNYSPGYMKVRNTQTSLKTHLL